MVDIRDNLKIVRWGLSLSLLAILLGFVLGGVFGAFEEPLKDWLHMRGETVLSTVYANDSDKLAQTVNRAWGYFKRAHMHGGGIGSAALGLSLLLSGLGGAAALRAAIAAGLGLGALGYSSFWMFAGMRAPLLGSTDAAKESLSFVAIPSAGLLLIGTSLTLGLTVWTLWRPRT